MTPQLENAIAAIQPLSPTERGQLLQLLAQENANLNQSRPLNALSAQFWQGETIEEIVSRQNPITFSKETHLQANFWPEDESDEDFLHFLRQQRREITRSDNNESSSD